MRRGGTPVLGFALLTACGQAAAPQAEPVAAEVPGSGAADRSSRASAGPTPPPTPVHLAAPETLIGEWRVAAIDGREPGGSMGLALSIEPETVGFEPRCAGYAWRYRYADGAVRLTRTPGAPLAPGARPPPACGVAVSPQQRALAAALDVVTLVRRTASNGVELSGGGRSVTLYRQ